jgi:hypothetical protein
MYAIIILFANRLFADFDFSDSIFFHLLFFLLIAFAIGPLKAKIQGLVDNIFSKGKYDYQKTIKNVSRMIASVLNLDEIAKHLMDTVVNVMKVDLRPGENIVISQVLYLYRWLISIPLFNILKDKGSR